LPIAVYELDLSRFGAAQQGAKLIFARLGFRKAPAREAAPEGERQHGLALNRKAQRFANCGVRADLHHQRDASSGSWLPRGDLRQHLAALVEHSLRRLAGALSATGGQLAP
jgi:hypothetical protein